MTALMTALVPLANRAKEHSMQVVGVVVTYNRADVLDRSLDILAHQSRPLDHLIVVDNGNDPTVKTLLENAGATANNGTGIVLPPPPR